MNLKRAFRATEHKEKAKYGAMNKLSQNDELFPDTNALNFFAALREMPFGFGLSGIG